MIPNIYLSDERTAEHAIVCWPALEEHERRSFQLVAKAAADNAVKQVVKYLDKYIYVRTDAPYKTTIDLDAWKELKKLLDK